MSRGSATLAGAQSARRSNPSRTTPHRCYFLRYLMAIETLRDPQCEIDASRETSGGFPAIRHGIEIEAAAAAQGLPRPREVDQGIVSAQQDSYVDGRWVRRRRGGLTLGLSLSRPTCF